MNEDLNCSSNTFSSRPCLGHRLLLRLLREDSFGGKKASKRLEMVVRWNRPDLAEEVNLK